VATIGVGRCVVAEVDAVRCARVWFLVIAMVFRMYGRRQCRTGVLSVLAAHQCGHELLELSDPVMDTICSSIFLGSGHAPRKRARKREASIDAGFARLLAVASQPWSSACDCGRGVTRAQHAHFLRLHSVHDRVGLGLRLLDGTSRWDGVSAFILNLISKPKGYRSASVVATE
jgi:hypothetical protein